jgi:hypothetical protein
MFQTQRFILACLALILGVGLGVLISKQIDVQPPVDPVVEQSANDSSVHDFKNGLALFLNIKHHRTLEEATPATLMGAFPTLIPEDFHGVETTLGRYEYTEGSLVYSNTEVVDAAADVITDGGMKTLRDNIYRRLGFKRETNIIDIVEQLTKQPVTPVPQSGDTATTSEQTICTLDAKVCPDGTAVGRTGPDCAFAACPGENTTTQNPQSTKCTAEQKGAEACIELYAPVCASVQIQCITTPCEPIPKTYSNSCFACSEHSVDSYTEGACTTE